MLAALLSLGLFAFWGLTGYALLALLSSRRRSVRNLLLAPAIGASLLEIILFFFVRSGIPIRAVGVWLAIVLAAGSITALYIRRPHFPFRRSAPFAVILGASFLLTGWPLLKFGFDWIANCNDDMANYCLGASGFLNHAYSPDFRSEDLEECKDMSRYYWFLYVASGVRSGSELMIAQTSCITGLSTQQTFMPVILAFYLMLISSVGSLVYRRTGGRRVAIGTCALLALSPLTSYSVMQQVIAQVGGLALLCSTIDVLCRPMRRMSPGMILKRTLLSSIVSVALIIQYVEISPFAVLSYALYVLLPLLRSRFDYRSLIHALVAASIGFVIFPGYFLRSIFFLIAQVKDGQKTTDYLSNVFPYYLEPSGFSKLWGLQTLMQQYAEPYETIAIIFGISLSILCAYGCFKFARRRYSFALLGSIMMLLGLRLAITGSAFGLFKLAMFLQPVLVAVFVASLLRLQNKWSKLLGMTALSGWAITFYSCQQIYIASSVSSNGAVRNGSGTRIVKEIRHHLSAGNIDRILVDTDNNIIAKFIALESRGTETAYPTMSYFADQCLYAIVNKWKSDSINNIIRPMYKDLLRFAPVKYIDLKEPHGESSADKFNSHLPAWIKENQRNAYLLGANGRMTVFNRYYHPETQGENLFLAPLNDVRNHAIFIATDLGHHMQHTQSIGKTSMYQLETDIYFPVHSFAGCGRHVTMMVLNPSRRVRLLMNMTTTLQPGSDKDLPPAAVIGESRIMLPLEGQGSARVVSDPIECQNVDGFHFLAVEMGVDGKRFNNATTGLNKLWKKNLAKDPRLLVGFVRDISILSEEEYQLFTPPEKLSAFPQDLGHPQLEYCGIYEDGWVGKSANVTLTRSERASSLVIRGNLIELPNNPSINQEVTVRVNGREALRQKISTGGFELRPPVRDELGKCKIELEFSELRSLPDPDNRPISIQLLSIGFERDRSPSEYGHALNQR